MAKYLIETTEKYRVDSEREVEELINSEKHKPQYMLSKYTSTKKEVKAKGEIIDEYYVVTLTKAIDNMKEPCGDCYVVYKNGVNINDEN